MDEVIKEVLEELRHARMNVVAAKGLTALTYLDSATETLTRALDRIKDQSHDD